MLEKAISKIKSEINQNKTNLYVQVVGDFLLQQLERNPEAAEKILDNKKSILKSLDEMKKAAEKKRAGNCAVLTDEEGFEIVLKYFEIKLNPIKSNKAPETNKPDIKTSSNSEFDIDLDDLLKEV
ncbi:MAG: hypothetical protein Q8936_21955 [Bacillota bacterium]|nr:hypothetical protein [Bacillota bacterium]